MAQPIKNPTTHWLHDFSTLKISTTEFYTEIENEIKIRNIPECKISHINLNQTSIFSARREYLRIVKGEMTFDVCAAPYGNGFFISWWFGDRIGTFKALGNLLHKIPVIGPKIAELPIMKTYFEWDTEAMFRSAVQSCINAAIQKVTSSKGIRGLSDAELQPITKK